MNTPSFVLNQLEVFNWGPFAGLHCADIDIQGSAIIGQTGSGKTTLVDALMTLITASPKYNLASTGGHESDRDLISYVRGVLGTGSEQGSNDHIMRPTSTVTGLSACFQSDTEQVRVSALFRIEGTSSALADLKRLWIFSRHSLRQTSLIESQPEIEPDPTSYRLADWLHLYTTEGVKNLKQLVKQHEGISTYDSKKSYLAQLKRFFEVGDNAFALLNRAAGLKQLNSIDELFRELVLDDRSAFDRANEVTKEFDDLKAIHAELEIAKSQQQSLLPIEKENQGYQNHLKELSQQEALLKILPKWFAKHAVVIWKNREYNYQQQIQTSEDKISTVKYSIDQQEEQVEQLYALYLKSGGATIEQLEQQLQLQQEIITTRKRNVNDYLQLVKRFQLNDALNEETLLHNQQQTQAEKQTLEQSLTEQQNQGWDLGAEIKVLSDQQQELKKELQEMKNQPGSNIPVKFLQFKQALAQAVDLPETQLAFIAELIEVMAEEQGWRGAIERAIGSHRLRLLIPESHMDAALAWVNQRDNRLHIRLLEAKESIQPPQFYEDGYCKKLNFKTHPLREALKSFLKQIDRHCVDSVETLKQTPHGMTQQGLMSGESGRFDKQDQRNIQEDWMTGFDNRDRLMALSQSLEETSTTLSKLEHQYQEIKRTCQHIELSLMQINELQKLHFHEIDLPGAQAQENIILEKLTALKDPNSDANKHHNQWQQAKQTLKQLRDQLSIEQTQLNQWQNQLEQAQRHKNDALKRLGSGVLEQDSQLADQHFKAPKEGDAADIARQELDATQLQQTKIDSLKQKVSQHERQLGIFMTKAQEVDTGALVEAGTDLEDIPTYLQRLQVLTQEALPEKLERFLDYLNHSSDQGVTQLLSNVNNEVAVIEERIDELNLTMQRVDFQPGRYLRLEPQRVMHERLRTLQQLQKELRSAALKDDAGESHYKALMNLIEELKDAVERKKTQGAKALLDPRYRLQFSVSVIDRVSGAIIETRTGSQGGSGGEKEIIASYILTASLSYALCPAGTQRPLFATIVLDEAFSKSSAAVANRIVSALREFGLHPLFITPNKEMRLLRAHTRSAILVHRRGNQATVTSLSWQELDQQARDYLIKVSHENTSTAVT